LSGRRRELKKTQRTAAAFFLFHRRGNLAGQREVSSAQLKGAAVDFARIYPEVGSLAAAISDVDNNDAVRRWTWRHDFGGAGNFTEIPIITQVRTRVATLQKLPGYKVGVRGKIACTMSFFSHRG